MASQRRPFLIMLAISVVAFVAIVVIDLLTPIPPSERLRVLRQEMTDLRMAADSCRQALDSEEARLLASDERLDSLRTLIDYYEGLDARGVPADSYEVYIEIFNTYNEDIPARAAAGDTLQAHWDACRTLTERHNAIADSAKALAEGLELIRTDREGR
jgi:hypothetical protein